MDQKHHTNVGKPNEKLEKLRRNLEMQGWWWYTRTPAQPHVVTPSFPFLPLPSSSLLTLFSFIFPLFHSFSHLFLSLFPFHSFSLFHIFSYFFTPSQLFYVFLIFSTLHVPPCSPLCYFSLFFFSLHRFNHYSVTPVFLSFCQLQGRTTVSLLIKTQGPRRCDRVCDSAADIQQSGHLRCSN